MLFQEETKSKHNGARIKEYGKVRLFFTSILFVFTVSILYSQDLELHSPFRPTEGINLPVNWDGNAAAKLKENCYCRKDATGSILIMNAGSAKVELYTKTVFAVISGKILLTRVLLQNCNGEMIVGYYGYDANGNFIDTQFQIITPVMKELDGIKSIFTFKPEIKKFRLFVCVMPNSHFELKGINAEFGETSSSALLYNVENNRQRWRTATEGTNMALGKNVTFDPQPNTKWTRNNATELTDGKIASGKDDRLWLHPDAVGWFSPINGANIIVDLGSVQPVRKVVIRIVGGSLDPGYIKFPDQLTAYASKNGTDYFETASLKKVQVTDIAMSNWKTHYYLPEMPTSKNCIPYTHPFELSINADARYVVIYSPFQSWNTMVTDEVAVIKEENQAKASGYNLCYGGSPKDLFHKNFIITARHNELTIPENINAPNFLIFEDRYPAKLGNISYTFDFPKNVTCHPVSSYPDNIKVFSGEEIKGERKIFKFKSVIDYAQTVQLAKSFGLGPFFFKGSVKNIPEQERYVRITTFIDGKENYSKVLPLKSISIPEVKRFTSLLARLDMHPMYAIAFPEFLADMTHIGLTHFLVMPILYPGATSSDIYNKARAAGFKITNKMHPSYVMYKNKDKEFRCIGHDRGVCPSYRGKLYQELLRDIEKAVKECPPDYICFDEEEFDPGKLGIVNCSRCNELRKAKGMSWQTFIPWVIADYVKGYCEAAKKVSPQNNIRISAYSFNPCWSGYNYDGYNIPYLGGYNLFPKYINSTEPCYYNDNPRALDALISKLFDTVKNPFLINTYITATAGASSELNMPFYKMEQLILQNYMSGAGGTIIHTFRSLESPMDYYYIAKALGELSPYEDIILKGNKSAVESSDATLLCTMRTWGDKSLLLVGNYGSLNDKETVITLPFTPSGITDIAFNCTLPVEKKIKLTVPKDGFRFLFILNN